MHSLPPEQNRPPAGEPPVEEGRIARSWRLTTTAWRLVRGDRTALVLALATALITLGFTTLMLWLTGWLAHPRQESRLAVGFLALYWPSMFVGSFLNVAFAASVAARFHGGALSVREALNVAVDRVGQIAVWSLLATGVGILVQEIATRLPWGGRVASWVLGAAWSLVTLFAIPILALEGCTATGCVRRSAQLMRRRWGESVSGTVIVTSWAALAILPLGLALGLAVGLTGASAQVEFAALAGLIVVVTTLAGSARNVFAVALYRYAVHGAVEGGFGEADLARPFTPKRRWLRRRGAQD